MRQRACAARLIFGLFLVLGLSSCNGFFVPETLTSLQVNPQTVSLSVGGTSQLTVTGTNNDGTPANVANAIFNSSDPQVAAVSSTGMVTGVSSGNATITATAQSVSGTTTVTVGSTTGTGGTLLISPADQTVSSSMGGMQFSASLNGQDVTASAIWSSTNAAVAQFSGLSPGLATFTGQGTTTITATLTSNGTTNNGSTTLTVGP